MAGENEDRIEVTEENFGDLLIQGLREVHQVVRGEAEPARRVRRTVTAREADVRPPQAYTGAKIRRIREGMGVSQNVFARVLNASPDTVKAWEQDKRQPDGMALALLEVADRHPEALMDRVRKKAKRTRR
ncbi:MAG TPA: helix-turn-helix domain-containing protein [Longimicrobiaceae bacterium]|nr:helix-turn-helix domain-containing protein [Longimicrobiaceae bacterium]